MTRNAAVSPQDEARQGLTMHPRHSHWLLGHKPGPGNTLCEAKGCSKRRSCLPQHPCLTPKYLTKGNHFPISGKGLGLGKDDIQWGSGAVTALLRSQIKATNFHCHGRLGWEGSPEGSFTRSLLSALVNCQGDLQSVMRLGELKQD